MPEQKQQTLTSPSSFELEHIYERSLSLANRYSVRDLVKAIDYLGALTAPAAIDVTRVLLERRLMGFCATLIAYQDGFMSVPRHHADQNDARLERMLTDSFKLSAECPEQRKIWRHFSQASCDLNSACAYMNDMDRHVETAFTMALFMTLRQLHQADMNMIWRASVTAVRS